MAPSIDDFFGFFVNSIAVVEESLGIRPFVASGIVVEHPLALLALLPLFAVGIFVGLRYPKFGALFTVAGVAIAIGLFVAIVGLGIDVDAIASVLFLLVTLPIVFALGCVIGWLTHLALSRVCRDRDGGVLCKIIR